MGSPKRSRGAQPKSPNWRPKKSRMTQGQITPTKPPPTAPKKPTRAHQVFEKVQRCWDGHPVDVPPAGSVRLRRSEFTQLLALLAQEHELLEFAFRNLKFFYDYRRKRLTYVMPSRIHEEISGQLAREISEQFWVIKCGLPDFRDLMDLITYANSCEINMPGDEPHDNTKYPDGVWHFRNPKRNRTGPCFMFEVCFSQMMNDAVAKIRQILLQKKGRPGMALAVKLQYASPKQLLDPPKNLSRAASYTAFQWILDQDSQGKWGNGVICTIPRREFRDKDGNVVPGELSFSVRDFLGKEVCDRLPNSDDPALYLLLNQRVTIDHSLMVKWIRDAEDTVRREAVGDSSSSDSEEDLIGHLGSYEDVDGKDQESNSSGTDSTKTSFSDGLAGDTEYESPTPIKRSDPITDRSSRSRAKDLHDTELNTAASNSSESTRSATPGSASDTSSQNGVFPNRAVTPLRESPDPLSTPSQEHRIDFPVTPSKPKRTHSTSTSVSDSSTDPLSTNNPEYIISPHSNCKRYRRWL